MEGLSEYITISLSCGGQDYRLYRTTDCTGSYLYTSMDRTTDCTGSYLYTGMDRTTDCTGSYLYTGMDRTTDCTGSCLYTGIDRHSAVRYTVSYVCVYYTSMDTGQIQSSAEEASAIITVTRIICIMYI